MITIPKGVDIEEHKLVIEQVLQIWTSCVTLSVLKSINGGRSGACVLLVDIQIDSDLETDSSLPALVSGQFILKIDKVKIYDPPEPNEFQRHLMVQTKFADFARIHVPMLVRWAEVESKTALLYSVAGQNFTGSVTADTADFPSLQKHCRSISYSILENFRDGETSLQRNLSIYSVLKNWIGYRLDSSKAESKNLHSFIRAETSEQPIYYLNGRPLVNPLWFCQSDIAANDSQHIFLSGLIHGDLHTGNILLDKRNPHSEQFWVIDFALSQEGVLGYDHAYLEIALIYTHLEVFSHERLFKLLQDLENESVETFPDVHPHIVGLALCLRALRRSAIEWQEQNQPGRSDSFRAQMLLGRIAASLNWVNKGSLNEKERRVALAYGGWAGKRYMQQFHELEWDQFLAASDTRNSLTLFNVSKTLPSTQPTQLPHCWNEFWQEVNKFDSTHNVYIFVSPALSGTSNLAPLALLPVSSIIDLDSLSDQAGLCASIGEEMSKVRSVKKFGLQSQSVNFVRGTAWMMAGGWPSHQELVPESLRSWRRIYLPAIRSLLKEIKKEVDPHPITILVMGEQSEAHDTNSQETQDIRDRLSDVVLAADEIFGNQRTVWLGHNPPDRKIPIDKSFPISAKEFVAGILSNYGTPDESTVPTVPSGETESIGRATIPIDVLRNMEEEIEILHSRILEDSIINQSDTDAFWRGNTPTWADLHANADVERDIHVELVRTLGSLLRENRNDTCELRHEPGAGGSTVALRIAWTLRNEYPVAVVHRYSKFTLDRVDRLFRIAERPVLLILDSSTVSASARQELYQGFVQRNARVVMLYVTRVMRVENGRHLSLPSPMNQSEAQKFKALYGSQTHDTNRHTQINQITDSRNERWRQYRLPFFYGLVAYDRDFTGIDRYVGSYLIKTSYQAKRVLQYMALITRFSQARMSDALFVELMGGDTRLKLDLEALLGPAARLVLRQEGYLKILHPLLAEEVLNQTLRTDATNGEEWKSGLKDLALDFIHDVIRIMGPDANETDDLLVPLFISRDEWASQGGHNFSELIEAIPNQFDQHRVLEELAKSCPQGAHYWNHLGRHHIYRLKTSYEDAEKYLLEAVKLAPEERFHYHSLGMVYRFWAEDEITNIFRDEDQLTPELMLSRIDEISKKSFEAFREVRHLREEDAYGYISHIQLINRIISNLINASKVQNLSQMQEQVPYVREWIHKHLAEAEELLSRVQHLRGSAAPSRVENQCSYELKALYGDFNGIIKNWESMLDTNAERPDLRRVLASAYYARKQRSWNSLNNEDLHKIVDLMQSNLREDATNPRDIRMWFQAYKRLREFDIYEALGRLEVWAQQDAVDAHYYLYILHLLQWRSGTERDEKDIQKHLDACKKLSVGRSGHSYEWLAVEPSWCPLVNYQDLGIRDSKSFFPNKHLLTRFEGTIEHMDGPQAGVIKVGRSLRAFFVPGKEFWSSQDIGEKVNFYLGFAYDGLRAWEQQRGPLQKMEQRKAKDISTRGEGLIVSAENSIGQGSNQVLKRRVEEFIGNKTRIAQDRGQTLLISDLSAQMREYFPGDQLVHKRLGFISLTALLTSMDSISIEGKTPNQYIQLRKKRS